MVARIWRTTLYYKAWRFLCARFTMRQLKTFVWVFAAVMFLGSAAAVAADGQTTPTGFGDMVVIPDLAQGQDKTMMESYPLDAWQLDSELSAQDIVQQVMYGVDQILFFLLKTLVYITVGLVYWLFSFTNIDALSDGTASLIGGASASLMTWLFPSAVAIGAAVTYAMRQRDGTHNYNQIAWFLAAGIFTVSLTTSAPLWVNTVDNVRTIGTTATASMADPLLTEQQEIPFAAPQKATFNGTPTQNVLRKSADSLWRSLLATPWCIANYGSQEACKRYAPDMLAMGGDTEKRKNEYIKRIIYNTSNPENKPNEGSKEAATSQWVKGERYADRTGILVLAIIVALVFCLLLLSLGYAAIVSLAMAFMLLVAGVFFAMLWIIPGRPRQWGSRWFDTLLGTIMTSVVATLTFTVVMMFTSALFNLTGEYGWATATGLALVIVAAGFKLRASLESIFDAYNPNAARAAAVGFVASRAAGKGVKSVGRGAGRLVRGLGRAGRHYKGQLSENPPTSGAGGRGSGSGSPRGGGPGGRSPYRPNVPVQPSGPAQPQPSSRPGGSRGPNRPADSGTRPNQQPAPRRDAQQESGTRRASNSSTSQPARSATTPAGYKPQSRTLLTASPRNSAARAPRQQTPAQSAYRPTAPAQGSRTQAAPRKVQPAPQGQAQPAPRKAQPQQPPLTRRPRRGGDDGR